MNKTLEWVLSSELPGGGISAWQLPNGSWHGPYIEITGYILPTLVNWDAGDIILRCAGFLLRSQCPDGSFTGLDGAPRPFDTSAVAEGLEAVYRATGTAIYRAAANRAKDWMKTQITPEGHLKNTPSNPEPNIYNLRASAILGNRAELEYWKKRGLISGQQRAHYLAYALEGMLNFGDQEAAMPYLELAYQSGNLLQPFYVDHDWRPIYSDFDICASCQMAILFKRVGFDVRKHYKAIQQKILENGGVPQSTTDLRAISWGAKFYLDLVFAMENK